jgi:predicted ribosomally synthesized peptide with SipW-like signal peptide
MKQVISALIVIIIAASLATMGTLASFSDIETSPGNYFETGSLDLQLADADEYYGAEPLGDSVNMTWDYIAQGYGPNGGLNPDDSLVGTVWLRNVATDDASRLDISCFTQNFDEEGNPTSDGGKDTAMRIDNLTYTCDITDPTTVVPIVWNDGMSWDTTYIDDTDGDLRITLYDWEQHDICGLAPPAVDSEATLDMVVTYAPVDPDQYAGHETIMTLTFGLFQ